MPTDTANVAQEKILKAVQASQDASVQAVRRWAEAVATVVPSVPDLVYPERPDQAFDFEFASKLWKSQVDYFTKVLDALTGPLVASTRDLGSKVAAKV